MTILISFLCGLGLYLIVRVLLTAFYVIRPNERAVITSFGRAQRLPDNVPGKSELPPLSEEEHERYNYPAVQVVRPGGPYFKWPWQAVHKVKQGVFVGSLHNASALLEPFLLDPGSDMGQHRILLLVGAETLEGHGGDTFGFASCR